jgi:hypothetical protein
VAGRQAGGWRIKMYIETTKKIYSLFFKYFRTPRYRCNTNAKVTIEMVRSRTVLLSFACR